MKNSASLCIYAVILLLQDLCKTEIRECFINRQDWMLDSYVSQRQLWTYTFTSVTLIPLCGLRCMSDEACVSFYFNTETNVCSGHSIVLANMTLAESQPGSLYFTLDCRGDRYIGTECEIDVDCVTANSRCDDGYCECDNGNAFWPNSRTCVTECTTGYGSSFTAYEYRSIAANNNAVVENSTMEECKQHCLAQTSFVCRTFDFWLPFNMCLMSNITKYTVVPDWYFQWDNTARHFVRDCL